MARSTSTVRAGVSVFISMAALSAATILTGVPGAGPVAAASNGPFATLLFSRTEITAADGCTPNDTNIARLNTEVAPYLNGLGMVGVGTLQTGDTAQSSERCVHDSSSMAASWDEAASLSDRYGWSFVSHTATYPSSPDLTPTRADAETCKSAAAIDAHGLHGGHGLIAYPGAWQRPTSLQTNFGAKCFAWGRWWGNGGVTPASAGFTPPYWQHTIGAEGGPCNDSTQACYTVSQISGSQRYALPSTLIDTLHGLGPGQWLTLETFILVKGKSPSYAHSKVAWDCTATDPRLHWTNDNERYCYDDWRAVVQALAAMPSVTVTDPLTVGVDFGRPSTYPDSALGSDTTPPTTPTNLQATPHTGDSGVSLAWTASSDDTGVAGYRVQRSADRSTWTTLSGSAQGTTYTDSTTSPGTTYYYRVQAFDAAGNSSGYDTTSVTTSGTPGTKQFVTNSGFESGNTSGWRGFNHTSSITAVQPTGGGHSGQWAARALNTLTSANQTGILSSAPYWVSSTVAGTTYTASGWFSGPAGTVIALQLRECNSAGTSCPGLRNVKVTLPSSGWVRATVPYTAQTNGDGLKLSAHGILAGGASFLIDDMTITAPQ